MLNHVIYNFFCFYRGDDLIWNPGVVELNILGDKVEKISILILF